MFTGLSAFPLTPLHDDQVDEEAFVGLIQRLAAAGVDSITALGSTGSYAYLSREEHQRVANLAVENAGDVPVFVGIGALRTSQVLANADDAAQAGASALLLAPMSYQALTADDVFELFRAVTEHTDLPVIVYDNPGTTHFTFTTELYSRLAALDGVASIKIPGSPASPAGWDERIGEIRAAIGDEVTIGISGDVHGAEGLIAGCDAWYAAVGGTLPEPLLEITRAAELGNADPARELSAELQPLWDLFTEFGGSLRVSAAIAEHLGLVAVGSLPLPVSDLDAAAKRKVAEVAESLDLA